MILFNDGHSYEINEVKVLTKFVIKRHRNYPPLVQYTYSIIMNINKSN